MSSIYLLLLALILLSLLNLYILLFHRRKESRTDNLNELQNAFNSFEHYNREEISKLRTELLNISAENRKELNESIEPKMKCLFNKALPAEKN